MFIVLDGSDGAGKSTQIDLLKTHYSARDRNVLCLREPGGTPLGERVRELLLNGEEEMSPLAECFLFNAARAELVTSMIAPALAEGRVVLCDRFWPSTVVYQSLAGGLDMATAQDLCARAVGATRPDHILILDVPVSVTLTRLGQKRDRFEGRGEVFLEKVRGGFRKLSRERNWPLIDAQKSPAEVAREILGLLS